MKLDSRGSSIIEGLLAALVISVGIIGLALLTGGLVRGNRQSDRLGGASFAVIDQMERLLAGVPLNADGDLSLGPHPPDSAGSPRYEGLDAEGAVKSASVAAGAAGFESLRRWVVTAETSSRCLRRVRISVLDSRGQRELAAAESLFNCF